MYPTGYDLERQTTLPNTSLAAEADLLIAYLPHASMGTPSKCGRTTTTPISSPYADDTQWVRITAGEYCRT